VDNEITASGVILGATQANCPVTLATVGINKNVDASIPSLAAKIAMREIKSIEAEEIIHSYSKQYGIYPRQNLTHSFLIMAENLGLCLPGSHKLAYNSGELFAHAVSVGADAATKADDITTVKRLIDKKKLAESITKSISDGAMVGGILKYKRILDLIDLKMPVDLLNPVSGTAGCGYVDRTDEIPVYMSGKAWVYDNIADALAALLSNAIDKGVIVIRNVTGQDVSAIGRAITVMNKQNDIAIATDGFMGGGWNVLAVTNVTPDGYANEEFANIHNGDELEIDTVKMRFNTNILIKEMKTRAKRNITKKQEVFF
jgi:dihydroxyacid dehydratase/phosphogluconate dehydratase